MKSALKYIDKAIQFEVNKLLKEEIANPVKDAKQQVDYDEDQLDKLKTDIKKFKNWEASAMSDIKGLQQQQRLTKDPVQKSVATTSLTKIATPKDKDLKTMIADKEEEQSNLENKINADNLKLSYAVKGVTATSNTSTQEENISELVSISPKKSTNGKISLPMMTRTFFTEQDNLTQNSVNNLPTNKAYLVQFDKKTQAPFDVKFTERGFSINGTRLSFEALENALSKNYTITLNNGKGLMLDAIRMQKILKYKDRFFNGQR